MGCLEVAKVKKDKMKKTNILVINCTAQRTRISKGARQITSSLDFLTLETMKFYMSE